MNLTASKTSVAKIVLFFVFLFAVLGILSYLVKIEGLWFVFPFSNSIRVSTVVTAIACFMIVLFLTRKKGLKSIYYASLAVIFSIGLYELIWFNLAVLLGRWGPKILEFSALLGWVFLGLREVFRTKPPRISIALYSIYVASMIAWVSLGFKFNIPGTSNYDFIGETLNVVSKFTLPIGYAFHIAFAKTSVRIL
jgi:hypothetical protein